MSTDKEQLPSGPTSPAAKPVSATEREVVEHEVPEVMDFLRENGMSILIGVGVAVAIFAGYSMYKNQKTASGEAASVMLFNAQNPEQTQKVIDEYPSTPAAALAYISLASQHFEMGQFELAEHVFTQFQQKFPQHTLAVNAQLGLAQCMEATGRLDDALAAFEKFMADHKEHYLYSAAVFGKGRCLEQLSRFDEAKAVYEDFIAANPQSPWASRAENALLFVDRAKRAMAAK